MNNLYSIVMSTDFCTSQEYTNMSCLARYVVSEKYLTLSGNVEYIDAMPKVQMCTYMLFYFTCLMILPMVTPKLYTWVEKEIQSAYTLYKSNQ